MDLRSYEGILFYIASKIPRRCFLGYDNTKSSTFRHTSSKSANFNSNVPKRNPYSLSFRDSEDLIKCQAHHKDNTTHSMNKNRLNKPKLNTNIIKMNDRTLSFYDKDTKRSNRTNREIGNFINCSSNDRLNCTNIVMPNYERSYLFDRVKSSTCNITNPKVSLNPRSRKSSNFLSNSRPKSPCTNSTPNILSLNNISPIPYASESNSVIYSSRPFVRSKSQILNKKASIAKKETVSPVSLTDRYIVLGNIYSYAKNSLKALSYNKPSNSLVSNTTAERLFEWKRYTDKKKSYIKQYEFDITMSQCTFKPQLNKHSIYIASKMKNII